MLMYGSMYVCIISKHYFALVCDLLATVLFYKGIVGYRMGVGDHKIA